MRRDADEAAGMGDDRRVGGAQLLRVGHLVQIGQLLLLLLLLLLLGRGRRRGGRSGCAAVAELRHQLLLLRHGRRRRRRRCRQRHQLLLLLQLNGLRHGGADHRLLLRGGGWCRHSADWRCAGCPRHQKRRLLHFSSQPFVLKQFCYENFYAWALRRPFPSTFPLTVHIFLLLVVPLRPFLSPYRGEIVGNQLCPFLFATEDFGYFLLVAKKRAFLLPLSAFFVLQPSDSRPRGKRRNSLALSNTRTRSRSLSLSLCLPRNVARCSRVSLCSSDRSDSS